MRCGKRIVTRVCKKAIRGMCLGDSRVTLISTYRRPKSPSTRSTTSSSVTSGIITVVHPVPTAKTIAVIQAINMLFVIRILSFTNELAAQLRLLVEPHCYDQRLGHVLWSSHHIPEF